MRSHILSGGLLSQVPDESLLSRVLPYTYLVVACPFCKSGVGSDCRTPNYSSALGAHVARKKAAAQLDDMERYRRFAQLRAEQVAARQKTEAILARPLTAEQQATRKAISDAFEQSRAEFRIRNDDRPDEDCHPVGVIGWDLDDEAWREARKQGLGGSDISAVLGFSTYNSPWEVWADKTGVRSWQDQGSAAADLGVELEPWLLA
jgi:hypothetical protein